MYVGNITVCERANESIEYANCNASYENELSKVKISAPESHVSVLFVAIQVTLIVFILAGNGLILLAIRRSKTMRKVSYYFIGNLAAADILYGFILAVRMLLLLTGNLNTAGCIFILMIVCISGQATATGILILCLESYLSVRHIMIFKTTFTPKVAFSLIAISWLVAIMVNLFSLYKPLGKVIPPDQCYLVNGYYNYGYLVTISVIAAVLLTGIFTFEILTIYYVRKHFRAMLSGSGPAEAKSDQQKRMLKKVSNMSQLVVLIMAAFVLSWVPFSIALFLYCICPESCNVTGVTVFTLALLMTVGSAANVIIYAIKSKEFRMEFKKMFTCQKSQVGSMDASTTNTT